MSRVLVSDPLDLAIIVEQPVNADTRQGCLISPELHDVAFGEVIYRIGFLADEPELFIFSQTHFLTDQKYN